MFGVSFATLKELVKKIGVDHDLAVELWGTGNHDARILAAKIADPARATPAQLDRWAKEVRVRSCGGYVALLAAEGPHGTSRAEAWLGSSDERLRCSGWTLAGHLALVDETTPDPWFERLLARIAQSIHDAPNDERSVMNTAVIQIGCRNGALRKAAAAAAKRIGKVDVDHGDTSCKTQDAADALAKTWAHAKSKGFDSPAAQERARETLRTRC
jgi:3-methyladenine DNA glycosylase AlkD